MKHEIRKYGETFGNKIEALKEFDSLQWYCIRRNLLTTSYVNIEYDTIELTVHIKLKKPVLFDKYFKYSEKIISSASYYSEETKHLKYIRTVRFTFKYNR